MAKQVHAFWRTLWTAEYGLAAAGAGVALLTIMVVTVLSVAGRYILHTDLIPGAYNLIERVLFPLMVFCALPLSHRDGMFPKLDVFLAARMSRRQRGLVALAVGLVELAVYAVLMYFIWLFLQKAIASNRTLMIGVATWPMWPVAVMMPLAFGLMMIEMVRLVWRDMRVVLTGQADEEDEVAAPPPETL